MKYTATGDILALAVCLINLVLLQSSYRLKQKTLKIFLLANFGIIAATVPNMIFRMMLNNLTAGNRMAIVELRDLSCILLICVYCLFIYYVSNLIELNRKWNVHVHVVAGGICIVCSILTVLEQVFSFGFYISKDLTVHESYLDAFYIAFYIYACLFFAIMIRHKRRLITHMYWCLLNVFVFVIALFSVQIFFRQTTFTGFTYALLLMAVLFLFHHNPFDLETGTLNAKAFTGYVDELRGEDFTMVHLSLRDMTMNKVFEMSEDLYHFNEEFFRKPLTFRLGESRMIMVCRNKLNPNRKENEAALLIKFGKLYEKYNLDYRIIITENFPEIKTGMEYIDFLDFTEQGMDNNSAYRCTQYDVDLYLKQKYVEKQLYEIYKGIDLNDDRVLVYCQPVLNAETGKFTTAEALMRLDLSRTGIIQPDNFIPVAEKHEYIHVLSKIILNKTCKVLHELLAEGFVLDRISVNFSVQELHSPSFCDEIIKIIDANDVPYDKIAIELTESRNEQDFEMMRKTILRLRRYGIRFYLDDFGTGYSNVERILGLPIDIIKFDRSMTVLSAKDETSQYMVGAFSNIFKKSDYQVLFEGVEDETDENRCRDMHAAFLQGYRYSRPIPIDNLREFLDKTDGHTDETKTNTEE